MLKAAEKKQPGIIARSESLVQDNPSIVEALKNSPPAERAAKAIVKGPYKREIHCRSVAGALLAFAATFGFSAIAVLASK